MTKTNHQHIIDTAASHQHLWKFTGELSHRSDSFLISINDFKKLMRQIARYRSDDEDSAVEYVLHLVRDPNGSINLKFLASLPFLKRTGDEIFIHESELYAIVHSLWEGDVLRFAAYEPDPAASIADCLGYPAEGSLETKMVISRGIMNGQAGAAIDTSCALCGK